MVRRARTTPVILIALVTLSCNATGNDGETPSSSLPQADSARTAFAAEMMTFLLDTHLHEMRGHLSVKVRNTNPNDPEAPLVDRIVAHPSADPGPHTYLGVMHAEVGALRALLGDTVPVSIEEDRVFAGRPEVLIRGHRHGNDLYVPVRLFARVYGAYVRTSCPLANCADVWPRDILLYMKRSGYLRSAGVLEGYLEGLLDSINVRKLPTG